MSDSARQQPLKIEIPSLEELVLLASSTRLSAIHIGPEKRVAFCFLSPLASLTPIIYYCKLEKVPSEKFAHLDRVTARIRFGDKPSSEPNEISILLVRVRASEIL